MRHFELEQNCSSFLCQPDSFFRPSDCCFGFHTVSLATFLQRLPKDALKLGFKYIYLALCPQWTYPTVFIEDIYDKRGSWYLA